MKITKLHQELLVMKINHNGKRARSQQKQH